MGQLVDKVPDIARKRHNVWDFVDKLRCPPYLREGYLISPTDSSPPSHPAAGENGQFRTPRHIINMMVELMQPTLKDSILEIIMQSMIQCQGKIKKYAFAV